jgi:hypothetical protein
MPRANFPASKIPRSHTVLLSSPCSGAKQALKFQTGPDSARFPIGIMTAIKEKSNVPHDRKPILDISGGLR